MSLTPPKTEMTLHQLRIFCALAQSATMTRAGKQLGLAQPTLSQQLAKLEESLGVKLFERGLHRMSLTDAGDYLLRQAHFILADVDRTQATLGDYARGDRGVIRVAGLNSIIRALLPCAMELLAKSHPATEFDIHEVAPADALALLHGRAVTIALIAAQSLASDGVSFQRIPLVEDPYVLAVPAALDLSAVSDPDHDLPPAERTLLNSCIQFNFGTLHTERVAGWYQAMLPGHRLIAQCRSYELALGLVRAGKGVCLVPSLTASDGQGGMAGVTLYATSQPARRSLALLPSQYLRVEPYKSFIRCLQQAGAEVRLPPALPVPPFIGRVLRHAAAG